MFTTATNFLARHAFVVMPKTSSQDNPRLRLQFTYPLPYGAVLRDGGVQFVVLQPLGHGDAGAALRRGERSASRAA